jgi:HAD superfamily hydrolase (TIGR01490 family)
MEIALFDLDNTLLIGDSDYEWAQFLIDLGVLDRSRYEARNQEFYDQYKAGTLDIFEFLQFQLAPLAAHSREVLDQWHGRFMDQRIRPMIGARARALVAAHRDRGRTLAIVTATNAFVTAPIARELGVPNLIATDLEERDGAFTGRPFGTPSFREGKVKRLTEWLTSRNQRIEDFRASWFYSDSINDLPLLEQVTHPVAVDPDDHLLVAAQSRGWPVISLR